MDPTLGATKSEPHPAVEHLRNAWGQPLDAIFSEMLVARKAPDPRMTDPVPRRIVVLRTGLAKPAVIMIRREYLLALHVVTSTIYAPLPEEPDPMEQELNELPEEDFNMTNNPPPDGSEDPSDCPGEDPALGDMAQDDDLFGIPIDANLSLEEWLQTPPTMDDIRKITPLINASKISCPKSSFIVSGPPGIGKTLWLHFVLALRLSNKLPTVIQFEANSYFYFRALPGGSGHVTHHNFSDEGDHVGSMYDTEMTSECWWLIDASSVVFPPRQAILDSDLPIIQAAFPREDRVEWGNKRGAHTFFMRTWSRVELICARMLQPRGARITEGMIYDFCRDYIMSARVVFLEATRVAQYDHSLDSAASKLNRTELELYAAAEGRTSAKQFSHHIFTLVPQRDRLAPPVPIIPTVHLRECVEKALARRTEQERKQFYRTIATMPIYSAIAGAILEDRMHYHFPLGLTGEMYTMKSSTGPKNAIFTYDQNSPKHEENFPRRKPFHFTELRNVSLKGGVYYRPVASNFPALDAFTYEVQTKTVTILQATVSAKHDLKSRALNVFKDELKVSGIRVIVWSPLQYDQLTISFDRAFLPLVTVVQCFKVDMEKVMEDADRKKLPIRAR